LEVERETIQGKLYFFRYPVEGGEFIPVATTRPETVLADTAVAVHPDDTRYKHLIGKTATVPMMDRAIPVIADEYVEMEFGTGALKVTPGHDFNDHIVGERHNLPVINVMNKDATMNENAGPYAGLDRFECREKIWADMTDKGLTIEARDYETTVPISQRGGEIIEPLVSEQWFVNIQPLADKAIAAVRDGTIKIVPERFEKVYFHWLENIQDWCISRQLWWGHRIPAWYHSETGEIRVLRDGPPDDSGKWEQDPDVLDTWFSSGLWPFSTLGWPQETPDMDRYYPTSVLETGYDILFFWVARMIMMGLWFTDKPPFTTVYLHGLVRDEKGDKMSKTKGNVVDPLDTVDEYGTDAVRFNLLTGSTPGNDMNLSIPKVEHSRNFGNKLWQMARFIQSNLEGEEPIGPPDAASLDLPGRWIMSRLTTLVETVDRLFENYQYAEAGRQILEFAWDEFAPSYIEISKHVLYGDDDAAKSVTRQALVYVMDTLLRLLHPYMPYITEEIWQHLPHQGDALIVAQWPQSTSEYDAEAENALGLLITLVQEVRLVRNEYGVDPGKRINAFADPGSYADALRDYGYVLARLCNVESVDVTASPPEQAAAIVVADVTLYLPLQDMVDFEAERSRLQKELDNLVNQIEGSERQLANENFVSRAAPEVVQRVRDKLDDLQSSRSVVEERLKVLG
jgi:valyl-tRNA synthetase